MAGTTDVDKLWGGETDKAVANFPVSGEPIPASVARWLGRIKAAAARVNAELGLLDADLAERIAAAGDRVAAGELDDQFPIDIFQTGSLERARTRTPTKCLAALCGRWRPPERPRQHGPVLQRRLPVGRSPRCPRPGRERPPPGARPSSPESLERKALQFDDIVKSGRTHMMDAVPVTLGQEFAGYAAQARQGIARDRGCAAAARADSGSEAPRRAPA